MLKSQFCHLALLGPQDLSQIGECSYDQGGYFVINGSEKVLIAQEKMSNNHVYIFEKKMPSKFSHIAEVRSSTEVGSRPTSTMYIKLLRGGKVNAEKAIFGYH